MKSHQPRYAIRKYAVGVASVLVGFFASGQVVAADTPSVTESSATTLPTQPSEGDLPQSATEETAQPVVENQLFLLQSSSKVNRPYLIENCAHPILIA